ncbi:MAG: hypothetical protein BXU00_01465 [Candidatus Nanoclepta minutus]|uniref:CRISPR associated protein Cas6 C-terminal domain-containing protein n=1 Tax=Candidatus Nanoclepta minutus TaxID=1940235 RepID=A0A397WPC1_9ARCH|nr:MAG: hypothetical protein BXU00_01465 [Candidatus Nanoclepta minutus]
MRLLLEVVSLQDAKYNLIHNYIIQGFIYNLLRDTEFAWLHSYKGLKFFNFSNIFPIKDFKTDEKYKLIISSPNKKLIQVLYKRLKENKEIKLGSLEFKITNLKTFDIKLSFPWETSTPIILRKEKEVYLSDGFKIFIVRLKDMNILKELDFEKKKITINTNEVKEIKEEDLKYLDKSKFKIIRIKDVYFNFKKDHGLFEWLEELKRNSIIKYRSFTGSKFELEDNLFDELEFRKTVSIKVRIKERGDIVYIGSHWKKLNVLRKLDNEERRFYKFLLDTGLGILNSLGFGFVNPRD